MTHQTTAPSTARKFRPSLTSAEIQDCITALSHSMPQSTALLTLQLYQTRLLLRDPQANPAGMQATASKQSLLPEAAIAKPVLPAKIQEDYNNLYSSKVHEVMQGKITEAQLDEIVKQELAESWPEYAAILVPSQHKPEPQSKPEPQDNMHPTSLEDILDPDDI